MLSDTRGPVRGWPRPRARWEPRPQSKRGKWPARMLPTLWVLDRIGGETSWTAFHPTATDAHVDRLCSVCGERMGGTVVLCKFKDSRWSTSGPGCHPRCAALAVKHCPHLQETPDGETVAFRWDWNGNGYLWADPDVSEVYTDGDLVVEPDAVPMSREAVVKLARTRPLGILPNQLSSNQGEQQHESE
jgi:hypothetical protein